METPEELRAEVDRLRGLVGPTEASYADLRRELATASDLVRAAEAANGSLRGRVVELEFELARALGRQERFVPLVLGRVRTRLGRVVRIVRRFRG
jgi:hypothetical protein